MGNEYGEAMELQKVIEYKEWRNFKKVIDKVIISCVKSQNVHSEHFVEHNKTISMPKNTGKIVDDYKLSRYACTDEIH